MTKVSYWTFFKNDIIFVWTYNNMQIFNERWVMSLFETKYSTEYEDVDNYSNV